MEILSTRLVRPKPTDKKSQFLKALRMEAEGDSNTHNGINDYGLQESNNNLVKFEVFLR